MAVLSRLWLCWFVFFAALWLLYAATLAHAQSDQVMISESRAKSTLSRVASPLAEQLIVTEINYNPPAEGEVDGDSFEFIELKNV
ncbi:MAG: hypothetical protein ACPGWR_26620, partial [Ardenticatenaceae bacterium]